MQLIDEATWKRMVQNGSDDVYNGAIVRFAERWANMMEREMSKGAKLTDIALRTSDDADTEDITCFMHGIAVSVLVHVWAYGDELGKWNKENGYAGYGVVNPAIYSRLWR